MDASEVKRAVNNFLGIGPSHRVAIRIPKEQLVEKREFCVSINLRTGKIERYHLHKDDIAVVTREMQYAVALTSSGSVWVHSYVSFEEAERLAEEFRTEFWAEESFTNRYVGAGGEMDGSREMIERTTWTARDKEKIKDEQKKELCEWWKSAVRKLRH